MMMLSLGLLMMMMMMTVPGLAPTTVYGKESPNVTCSPNQMRIEIPVSSNTKALYIQGLRDYPDIACRPHVDQLGTLAVLELDLDDVYRCAVTRMVNKQTGKQVYYQTLVKENLQEDGRTIKETLHVKCSIYSNKNHTITKRNVLPAGFQEEDITELDILSTNETTGRAPEPILGVGVRQAGKLVTGELNVSPGTPLQMEIFLDKKSAPIYGLLVTHMQVTDTKTQEETIIYNGCTVDPYLFENFNTVDGDFLTAKFRAFKFPESTYVQFKGTVNVCLDKCKGVECSDGQVGYGRRKRAISELPPDPNKIFEITITSFIKVGSENNEASTNEKPYHNNLLIVGDQTTELKDKTFYKANVPDKEIFIKEEEKYTAIETTSSSIFFSSCPMLVFTTLTYLFL